MSRKHWAPPEVSLGLLCRHFCRVSGQAANCIVGPAAISPCAAKRGGSHRCRWNPNGRRALLNAARLNFLLLRRGRGCGLLSGLLAGKASWRRQRHKKESLNNNEGDSSKHFDLPQRRYSSCPLPPSPDFLTRPNRSPPSQDSKRRRKRYACDKKRYADGDNQ